MAQRFFLEITDVSGSSHVEGFEGAFDVGSYSFGASAPGGGSQVSFLDVSITIDDETGLADLLEELSSPQATTAASLIAVSDSGGPLTETFRVNLAGMTVSSVHDDNGDGFSVVLHFDQIGLIDSAGAGVPATFGYDVSTEAQVPPPPDAVPGPEAGGTNPVTYFLLIDGLDGGSTQEGHEGWFELPSFSFTVSQDGTPTFSDLSVILSGVAGQLDLLEKVALAGTLAGVRIEGVNQDGQAVYDLTLADVTVSSVNAGSESYSAAFGFDRVQLETRAQQADGSLGPPDLFSWNLETDSPDVGTLPDIVPGNIDAPAAPTQYFLEVSGIGGTSAAEGFVGAFDLPSFSFGASAGGINPSFQDLNFTILGAAGSTDFLQDVVAGLNIAAVSVIGVTVSDGQAIETYRLNLGDATVTSVFPSGVTGGGHAYSISLIYDKLGLEIGDQTFGFDVLQNAEDVVPPDAVPGAPASGVDPPRYFLLIDGVDGGSKVEGHEGWFELPSFALGVAAFGGGEPNFGSLNVFLRGFSGLTALAEKLALGEALPGLRVEGVNSDGDAIYRLDVADVLVESVQPGGSVGGDAGSLSVSFDFRQVQLQTNGTGLDGGAETDHSFTWNRDTDSAVIDPLPALTPGTGETPAAATTLFLELTALEGVSVVEGYEGAFKVLSHSFGASNPISGGGGAGQPSFSDLSVTLEGKTGLTALMQKVASGEVTLAASLVGVHTGAGGLQEAFRVNLGDVIVSSVADGSVDLIQMSLAFREFGLTIGDDTFGYDVVDHAAEPAPPDAVPGDPADPVAPVKYFLLVDGLNGGSTDEDHEGWFELPAFSFGAFNSGSPGSPVPGQAFFSSLSVALLTNDGLTELLGKMAAGDLIAGLRIEGVRAVDGESVYDLDIADVSVSGFNGSGVAGADGEFTQLSFDYDRIKLTTRGSESDGGLGDPLDFTWNLKTRSSDIGVLPDIQPDLNEAPVAANDVNVPVNEDATVNVSVLANDSDPDGDTLSVVGIDTTGTKGTVTLQNGVVSYSADNDAFDALANGAFVTDTFSYTVSDGHGGTDTATVTMKVTGIADQVVVAGAKGPESFTGTGADERFNTGNGNDSVAGGGGADVLMGENGDDRLDGGAGYDSLSGGNGNDSLAGGSGNDTLEGGSGTDSMSGGAGDDRFLIPAVKTSDIDWVLDFRADGANDLIDLLGNVTVRSTAKLDVNGDGLLDTSLRLSNGQTLVLSNYTASLDGYVV